ncbi:hypothetical protein AAHN97_06310 [Chitinophaga niabensis]|uniref:hypothetical protein n=1 Tax=Chitinophaga niabensis TaxID=536979 RepID=UPI0031BA3A8B
MASVALCGKFCFFIQSSQRYPALYYGETEYPHPHPLIRIAFISQFMGKIICKNIPEGMKFDEKAALSKALQMAEQMLAPTYGAVLSKLSKQLEDNYDKIESYGNKIIDLAKATQTMCVNRKENQL